jgi:hypothetical protein
MQVAATRLVARLAAVARDLVEQARAAGERGWQQSRRRRRRRWRLRRRQRRQRERHSWWQSLQHSI